MKSTIHRLTHGIKSFVGIAPKKAEPVLQQVRKTTQLMDVQRRVGIYLRALWEYDFMINPTGHDSAGHEHRIPFIENNAIHLPSSYDDRILGGVTTISGLQVYRAAAAHAAAHLVYSTQVFSEKSLNKWQIALISTIEDARVEALAIRKFPGLKSLWAMQHTASRLHHDKTAEDYLYRLARALLDETYHDDDPWIIQGRTLFNAVDNLERNQISYDLGMTLAHAFLAKNIKLRRRPDLQGAGYRDNNRYLWDRAATDLAPEQDELPTVLFYYKQALLEGDKVINGEASDESIMEIADEEPKNWVADSKPYIYSEWDYKSKSETKSWVTLREMPTPSGDLQIINNIVEQHKHLAVRMKNLLHAIRHGGVRRIKKLEEGDEIDINAAIRAQIDIRQGVQPDPRIMMRTARKTTDISVLVLLDLSHSMNDKIKGQEQTALELTRQVSVLFANAIDTVGDPFAIHGFCSKSRHHVEYFRFKDFDQPYDDIPKARIAGMTGQLATRMGAAVRHATHYLNDQKSSKKLLMLITDGAPSDIDVRGDEYLIQDTKIAVEEADRNGIHTYCISLDPDADPYVSRIFGARNYIVVDHVKSLPEKMLMLYAALTR